MQPQTQPEKSLLDKTLEYWHLQRAAHGLPSPIKSPTVEKVLSTTTLGLRALNPYRPLAKQLRRLQWEAIGNEPPKRLHERTAATVLQLRK